MVLQGGEKTMTLLERLKDIVPVRTRPGESHEQKMRREIAVEE